MDDKDTLRAIAWAKESGLMLWGPAERICRSCDCNHEPFHEYDGGAILDTSYGVLELCWECLPVPGSPLANWEHWCPPELSLARGAVCILCGVAIGGDRGTGGSWMRGGPFCWSCPRVPDAEMEAWLLALRDAPTLRPPWAHRLLPIA